MDVCKELIGLDDGRAVETVLIVTPGRTTICVSSQVGCARGCEFCLTATMGMIRNLSCDEIINQVDRGKEIVREREMPELRNIVYMGMGEPLDNLREVERSLEILIDKRSYSFAPKHITVSTVGTTDVAIKRAAELPGRLAWSLHAADDALRKSLIPTARRTVVQLRDAFAEAIPHNRPLFVEVVLIDGINDRDQDADAIAALFTDMPQEVRINLLPMNPIGNGMNPTPDDRATAFHQRLRDAGYFCMMRRPRGRPERAACGQLAVLQDG